MKVSIVGVGMGNPALLTQQARKAIEQSDCLVGAARLLGLFADANKPSLAAISPQEIAAWLAAAPQVGRACVLVSGDVGFYSAAKQLLQVLSAHEVECICGISSLQYFCAQLGLPWEDAHVISLHGREGDVAAAVQTHAKTFVLTGGNMRVQKVCAHLCEYGLDKVAVHAGENLSYENERIVSGTASELSNQIFESLAVMLVCNPHPLYISKNTLADEDFIRADVPMTKQEVRAIALEKLAPEHTDTIYDIGAGTGAMSVALARRAFGGRVFAVEYRDEALALLNQNKEKLGAHNLRVVAGRAPQVLDGLPAPNCAFVGGSGGELPEIIAAILSKNPAVRICIAAVTLETLAQAVACARDFGLDQVEIVQVSASRARKAGAYHLMTAQNPVTLITARGRG